MSEDTSAPSPRSQRRHDILLEAASGPQALALLQMAYDTAYIDTAEVRFVPRRLGKHYSWALDMRHSLTHGDILRPIADAMVTDVLNPRAINQIVGYGFGSFPLLGAIAAIRKGINFGMIRPETKPTGFCKLVEGSLDRASPIMVVDDLVNSGRTLRQTGETMRHLGYQVEMATCVFQFGFGEARRNPNWVGVDVIPLATLHTRSR